MKVYEVRRICTDYSHTSYGHYLSKSKAIKRAVVLDKAISIDCIDVAEHTIGACDGFGEKVVWFGPE